MSKSNAKFLTSAPMRHVAVMSATASIGLMVMFVVDFVDMIFISMLGNAALAAAIGYVGNILFSKHPLGSVLRLRQVPWLQGHWDQVMKCLPDPRRHMHYFMVWRWGPSLRPSFGLMF